MRTTAIVAKNEFYRYFISPLAYVYLIGFLLLNGSFAFYFGHFFERGQADLLPMFSFQPWIYLLFVTGISMRLWAEEFRSGTILQIATLPISVSSLVWGKFIASWLFCTVALALTFPFWLVINWLGAPDNAVIFAGYLGSWLLAGCMLAISQTMSALTKNQVIALVLSVIANLLFFLSGLEYVLEPIRNIASPTIVDMVASFSFLTHFDTIVHGLFELRDLMFFAAIITLFNLTTILLVSFRTAGTTRWLKSAATADYAFAFCFMLLIFCGINLIGNTFFRNHYIDFTAEKMYTLTDSTKKVISKLQSPVTVRLYYSSVLSRKAPAARQMFDNIRLILQQYSTLADGKLKIRVYDPKPLSNEEDRAIAAGLQPLPIIDENISAYFGLTISDEQNHQQIIPFFPEARRNFVEQDLTEALYLLGHSKPKLGIISSLPMHDDIIANVVTPKWEIINQLERFYDVFYPSATDSLDDFDILLIAHPQKMSAEQQDKIFNYSINGGKILAFFDVATEAVQLVAPLQELLKASDYGTLPQKWGFKFLSRGVIADLENSTFVDATEDYRNNPEFTRDLIQFYLRDENLSPSSPITAKLHQILLTSASAVVPLENADIIFEPLLYVENNSEMLSAEVVYQRIHPAKILQHFQPDNKFKPIAAHISGTNPAQPFELIVVGDSDLLYDNFWATHQTILEHNYIIPILDNANFVLNALDYLRRDETLISLRGKSYLPRPFSPIEKARIKAARDFKIREKEIFDNINRAKTGMQEIIGKRNFENRQTFTPDELAVIAGIRKQIDAQRKELFAIRSGINQHIDTIKSEIKFFTIYLIPLILLAGLILPIISSSAASFSGLGKLKRRTIYIGLISLAVLAAGILSVKFESASFDSEYENKSLLPDLAKQINNVSTIRLQSHNRTLIFHKNAENWELEGYPHYLVYQNRIRSFLSALLEATYYEKKASGIENLASFGLTPIENPDSSAVNVILSGSKNKVFANLNIGSYDLDLGRGTRGAYIRFADSFQVWLAAADLIDLSLAPQNWTYSTLWNLQFGRIAAINQNSDVDYIANLTKELLNIHFIGALPATDLTTEPFHTLEINAEHDAKLTIRFYRDKENYLAVYQFMNISSSSLLQNFAAYAKGIAYKISAADMEKIIHAEPQRTTKQPS